jgi:hypothetical protein
MAWVPTTLFGHNGETVLRRASAPLLAILLALGVGACGSTVSTSSFKGEAHAVAQRISDLQSDVSALNEQKICEQDFSRAARARLSTPTEAGRHSPSTEAGRHSPAARIPRSASIPGSVSTCKQALKRQLGSIDAYELTVEKIAVSGAAATARVRSTWAGKLSSNRLKLVKEGGSWRVEGVG